MKLSYLMLLILVGCGVSNSEPADKKVKVQISNLLRNFEQTVQTQQRQQTNGPQYDSESYREIQRLNSMILDLRIENDVLQSRLSVLKRESNMELNHSGQGGTIYTEDDLLAERTLVRIYDLIYLYQLIDKYNPQDTTTIAQISLDQIRIETELVTFGITDIRNLNFIELELDDYVR